MKYVRYKARMIRAFIGLGLVVSLLVMLTGCWPFNTFPVAYFTASPLSGPAPLSVAFSAMLSEDPDGFILKWEWDFGDGSSGTGESASHTYTGSGTFTVVLRVTDDDRATATTQRTITVTAAEEPGGAGAGPTASFTVSTLVGAAPLTVTFNASASAYAGHAITYYSWDFGDGVTGTGMTTTHTYSPSVTTTYHVVLRIIAADNTEGTATKDITVTVSGAAPPSTAPTASFTANPPTETAPGTITFDPGDSDAAAGHDLTTYVWNFGDQSSKTKTTDDPVQHTYVTSQASQNFTVTLTVIDDHGLTDSYSRTVTVENRQPIAGFEMSTDGSTYSTDNIEITNAQTAPQVVWFQSEDPNWNALADPANRPNEGSTKPANFTSDKNLSYDPEGQWIAGDGWGITTYLWDFDGATRTVSANADPAVTHDVSGGCPVQTHSYTLGAAEQSRTFTVELEVIDELGARGTLTRTVKLVE